MIIFIGPPGAGKSLQAALVEERGLAKWVSVSKSLKENADAETLDLMKKGELLDDITVTSAISMAIHRVPAQMKILLDGFPRKESQLDWLFTRHNPRPVIGVINIELPDEEIMKRLSLRGRVDDNEETIKHRIELYNEEIGPIIKHFTRLHIPVIPVDGVGEIEDIYSRLHNAIETLRKGQKHVDENQNHRRD